MSTGQFDPEVTEFVTKLRAFIRARVPDDATADDVTQESLLKVYRSRTSLRDADRFEAWLYRIGRRALIDYYRKRRPSEQLADTLKSESEDETSAFRDAVLTSTIRYMEELPDAYRICRDWPEAENWYARAAAEGKDRLAAIYAGPTCALATVNPQTCRRGSGLGCCACRCTAICMGNTTWSLHTLAISTKNARP
jgi:RNA polymerase sigma factor (sigma-70 family)